MKVNRRNPERPKCPICGEPMSGRKPTPTTPARYGYNGDGHICSLRCAYNFAVTVLGIVRDCKSKRGAIREIADLLED